MSARDEFRPASADGTCTEAVWGPMCDEIDRLRTEVEQWRSQFREVEEIDADIDRMRGLTSTYRAQPRMPCALTGCRGDCGNPNGHHK